MDRLIQILRKPGAKGEISGIAPTQQVAEKEKTVQNVTGYVTTSKRRMLDRWLDWVVRASGSKFVFFLILSGLLTWALLGIPYGKTSSWQVGISDVQAILCYVFDSFLVRQQLNEYEDEMMAAAQVQSRLMSHFRMIRSLQQANKTDGRVRGFVQSERQPDESEPKIDLPQNTRFGRCITACAHVLGHLVTIVLFWVGVVIWIGIGPLSGWSDTWQLYMNSASSALMVFVFSFLTNIHERHSGYMKRCLDAIFSVDSRLELRLRSLTGDRLSNGMVIIPAPKMNSIQRAIFYYADFVGTLVGIAILMAVIAVWAAVGPLLHFSSGWWLLIGTYAGLVGMNDAFVLRNMQARLGGYVDAEFDKIEAEDERLFAMTGLQIPAKETPNNTSITYRISEAIGRISAHELSVVAAFISIVGLITGASAMRWSLTGQLLCNVPPSIIESFLMIVLITGHNSAGSRKIADLQTVHERRQRLLSFVNHLELLDGKSGQPIQRSQTESTLVVSVSADKVL
ncbi:hypothetical protein MferCBS31731_006474 [Microsporum ferrugineum]